MTFDQAKEDCRKDGVFIENGMLWKSGDGNMEVDKCRLTGARCYSNKCPKFHARVRPTNSLAITGLEAEYAEDMDEGGNSVDV